MLDTSSPPAFAKRFSEVKAQPGELYFHVLAQRSACVNVEEPITLFKRLEITPPAVLLEELELELLPPKRPPKIPVTAEPMVDLEEEVVDDVVADVSADVTAVVVVVVFAVVFFVVFLVVFFTG